MTLQDQLRAELKAAQEEIATLKKEAVPPYSQCEMCNESDCCEGEWYDGSELHCVHCGKLGEMTCYNHKSGHTFWVLKGLEDDE